MAFKRQHAGRERAASEEGSSDDEDDVELARPAVLGSFEGVTPVVAVDCEMVGVGPTGERSVLAR